MPDNRNSPIEIGSDDFRKIGHLLVDRIADFIQSIHSQPVTTGESPRQIQTWLQQTSLPENGRPPEDLMHRATELLMEHSLLNGHPKFFGYITSSAAPIGALADLLASSVNPNVGAEILSPMATEIEKQTVGWLAELIGLSPGYGGILVSGGNMANLTAFLAARTAKAPKNIKDEGLTASANLIVYCSKTTHTWIEKAAGAFGLGSRSIRWIQTDARNKMDSTFLEQAIENDLAAGNYPFIVVGTAGDVSTGVVDDLHSIALTCKKYNLWFHIDGAYGAPAAVIPELKDMFEGITEADSIALDPHKWLYSPLEAGCTLVKDPRHLTDTYSSHPEYYNFDTRDEDPVLNYYEYGFQNSRGFRALKVWLALQQVGRKGYIEMINRDIELSKLLFSLADSHPELEAVTQNLSIATLRYIPPGVDRSGDHLLSYLNDFNKMLLDKLQRDGEVFLSNAIVHEKYCLRACIVNFRTAEKDIRETIDIIVREGRKMYDGSK